MEEIIANNDDIQHKSTTHSNSSLNSIQEISSKKEKYFRISLILINIISLMTGIYLLNNRDFYLSEDYQFKNHRALYVFIIVYTLGMLSALIISFIIALILKLIYFLKNKKQNSSTADIPNIDIINNQQQHTRITLFILNNEQNDIAIIPYTLSYSIVVTIGLYFIALPYSSCLIINLFKNEFYYNFISFFWLYFFLIINLVAGAIMIIVLFYMVFKTRTGSVRKFEYPVSNENIETIREEIRDAIKL